MKKQFFILLLALLFSKVSIAQHQEINEKPSMWKGMKNRAKDSTTFLHAIKSGKVDVHLRYFFMATDNQKGLTDYFANAIGGALRYETAPFHGFQVAASGSFIFNIGSSDLSKPDSITGQMNRYEIGLFDIENPKNKKDITDLEEFYIKYNIKESHIIFGRQFINTPFINLQDGRMRPTAVVGLWSEINAIKKLHLEGGILYNISPRSTIKWFSPGESIGVYATGVNTDGTKALYADSLESKIIFIAGADWKPNKYFKLQVWELFTHNIFNTVMIQTDIQYPFKKGSTLFASGQMIRQDAVKNGGNEEAAKTYFEKNGKAMTFGARLGWKNKETEVSMNYNRITDHGRYLMPREWGREPFFTFLPRERNEGFGDAHAVMGKINYSITKIKLKLSLAAGYYKLPDVKNFRLNKYGLPSYTQINADIRYTFPKKFSGLEAQLLIAGKINSGETYNNAKFVINKTNMVLYNFVLNYHF
jgi:hypothetical protein